MKLLECNGDRNIIEFEKNKPVFWRNIDIDKDLWYKLVDKFSAIPNGRVRFLIQKGFVCVQFGKRGGKTRVWRMKDFWSDKFKYELFEAWQDWKKSLKSA